MSLGTKTGKALKNIAFQKDGAGSRLANAYTGIKPRGSLIAGGVVAGLGAKVAWEGGFGAQSINKDNALTPQSVFDPGGVSMQRSQHAQAINPSILASGRLPSTAPDLNATGDMVFGMHNGRHG